MVGQSVCRSRSKINLGKFREKDRDRLALAIARVKAVPVAAGERHYGRHGTHPLPESRAIDIVQPDTANTGGIFQSLDGA